MTLLASCELTYCLRPVRPDCPELFLTRSFAPSTTKKAKYFEIHVLAYSIDAYEREDSSMFSLCSNKLDLTGLITHKAETICVSFVYLGQAQDQNYY